jgi:hypothetical protein
MGALQAGSIGISFGLYFYEDGASFGEVDSMATISGLKGFGGLDFGFTEGGFLIGGQLGPAEGQIVSQTTSDVTTWILKAEADGTTYTVSKGPTAGSGKINQTKRDRQRRRDRAKKRKEEADKKGK